MEKNGIFKNGKRYEDKDFYMALEEGYGDMVEKWARHSFISHLVIPALYHFLVRILLVKLKKLCIQHV